MGIRTRRFLLAALGGPFVGALAGLVKFLSIMFDPTLPPDNLSGGGEMFVILLIGIGFTVFGAVIGLFAGMLIGGLSVLVSGPRKSRYAGDPKMSSGWQKGNPRPECFENPRFDL